MQRRALLFALPLLASGLFRPALHGRQAVDPDFLRMWLAAQQQRPPQLTSRARIAPADEPGTPLIVRGQLLDADGATPAGGRVVFAYQTDRAGHYDRPDGDGWRLKGWARTDADGRFIFETIRPGPYPRRQEPAHIHVGLDGPPGERRLLRDVLFEGDPRIGREALEQSRRDGDFGSVRPVRDVSGVPTVEMRFRLPGEFVF